MRVIIAGGRTLSPEDILPFSMNDIVKASGFEVTKVISGGAYGADRMGEAWARKNEIEIEQYHADWNNHGKAAGPIRNAEMAENADALIAIWDGISAGTRNMIATANKKGLKVYIHRYVAL